MKYSYQKYNKIEDFIFDNDFVELSERNDPDEMKELLQLYPDKEKLIDDAIALLQYLKIEMPDVPESQIEGDYIKLRGAIAGRKQERKNKRFYLWTAVASVASCAAIAFGLYFNPVSISDKDRLQSLIEGTDTNVSEIQIIAGKEQANIDNNETITQTEEGNLIVGNDTKMESSRIGSEFLTVVVPKGRRTTIRFSDGTTAWVNSGTKLVYPKTFSKKSREIIVDGEIFLDVAKDAAKPFIVHTNGFSVQVLGTRFNVNAYSADATNSVVLVEGSVEVVTSTSKGKLEPDQGFFTKEGIHNIKHVDTYTYICWKDDVMKLNGESLDIIFDRLSRHYGIDIRYDNRFALEKYKGKLDLQETIETVLYNLSLSTEMNYTKEGSVIVIK
ncbi:FecR family protein [Dysgonomonas sp. OttesenSCG-928-D17]|nr:FecR family protein [Dysgonomonas sp. OttesenSCG-928-D17]